MAWEASQENTVALALSSWVATCSWCWGHCLIIYPFITVVRSHCDCIITVEVATSTVLTPQRLTQTSSCDIRLRGRKRGSSHWAFFSPVFKQCSKVLGVVYRFSYVYTLCSGYTTEPLSPEGSQLHLLPGEGGLRQPSAGRTALLNCPASHCNNSSGSKG